MVASLLYSTDVITLAKKHSKCTIETGKFGKKQEKEILPSKVELNGEVLNGGRIGGRGARFEVRR